MRDPGDLVDVKTKQEFWTAFECDEYGVTFCFVQDKSGSVLNKSSSIALAVNMRGWIKHKGEIPVAVIERCLVAFEMGYNVIDGWVWEDRLGAVTVRIAN
jgi:hypothetical protein